MYRQMPNATLAMVSNKQANAKKYKTPFIYFLLLLRSSGKKKFYMLAMTIGIFGIFFCSLVTQIKDKIKKLLKNR